jgi:hypothetical protein
VGRSRPVAERLRGALLGDVMGAGKTVVTVAVVNTVTKFQRILVICMASAAEKLWVEHMRRWQTRSLRITRSAPRTCTTSA